MCLGEDFIEEQIKLSNAPKYKGRQGDSMRIPTDISLATWIRQLIADDKIIFFYKSKEWIDLKDEVMSDNHYECQECLKRGRYTRADCVHHVNEVRHRPDLALSKHYTDAEGKQQKQLIHLRN